MFVGLVTPMMFYKKLSSFEKLILIAVSIILLIGFVLALSNTASFESYVQEDGVIEWLTVLGLLAASAVSIYRGASLAKQKSIFFTITNLLLGLLLFVAAGEEISWGQRLFGVETPEYFKENNLQGETNLHNLEINGIKINQIVFSFFLIGALAIYLLFFPILYMAKNWMKRFTNSWGIPVAQRYQIIGFLLVFALTSLIPHGKKAELLECGAALLFFLIIRYPVNLSLFQKPQTDLV